MADDKKAKKEKAADDAGLPAGKEEKSGKKKVARKAARNVKDRWKAKSWYTVRAPKMFNGVPLCETLTDDTAKLMGRVAEATLQDLNGDLSKMHVKLHFKIGAVKGTDAHTKFVGHELTSDYIRRLTRRKHSKIDGVFDVTTSDGYMLRVKPMAITEKRATSSQEQKIRILAETAIRDSAKANDLGGFVKSMVNGDLSQVIFKEARKVYPLKRVEIRRSELRGEPEGAVVETDVFAPAAEAVEAAPAEGEATAEADAVAAELTAETGAAAPAEEELTEEERVD
ncbi:MAG TPA: 30S ribosomal protein S3ae [Candidatus Thermoplasmatota archaeon]|nr:30S ribosomal protein S3ae [Candidatus Thermoplasmatota archaeon]